MPDWIELTGKTALVTGAAKRLGHHAALALAREGVALALHYRDSEAEAQALARQVRGMGGAAWCIQADLADPTSASKLFAQAQEKAGAIDFLLNNASIFHEKDLNGFSVDDLHANIHVNALAPLILSRRLAEQGRPGCIVNFLDTMIADYDRKHVPYHLSKRMLYGLTSMMAVEFAPKIRVNAVAPGLVLPPEGEDAEYLERLKSSTLLERYGSPQGVSEAVLFLLRSGFITGQTIFIDGGRHLRGRMYE